MLEFRNQLWLLQHSDIRRSRRVKVVADALATALRSQRELIEGLLRDRGATLERRLQIRHTVGS